MLAGMKLRICPGIVNPTTCCWRSASDSIRAASAAPSTNCAPSKLKIITAAHPIKAATAVVANNVTNTEILILPKSFVCSIFVKAPTTETKINGMINICKNLT